MEMKVVLKLEDAFLLAQLKELLILGDKEFVPPLSSRSSTTQQGLAKAGDQGGIDAYFEEMKKQCFVLAMEGDRMGGFMSFKIDHVGAHIPEGINLYASTSVVHPDFRGQGLMTGFYKEMIRAFPERPVYTRTWHENAGHLKVLGRLGFECLALLENDRSEGIHTVYYGRKAGPLAEGEKR